VAKVEPEQRKQANLKIGAAMFGASVVVAMGVITATASGGSFTTSEPATPSITATTSTSEAPPSTPSTSKATPSVTATTSTGSFPETSTAPKPG
jgi:hypothetical protein